MSGGAHAMAEKDFTHTLVGRSHSSLIECERTNASRGDSFKRAASLDVAFLGKSHF